MSILGRALGRYLSDHRGLYSVQLPEALEGDLQALVEFCNDIEARRAFLVAPDGGATYSADHVIGWSELLKWRTDEDRVFGWTRRLQEPDSSFQSVVRPFVSGRFPGEPRGVCSVELFRRIGIQEVWLSAGLEPEPQSLAVSAFQNTGSWVIDLLQHNYQKNGGTLHSHWSSDFLVHWSLLLESLASGVRELTDREIPVEPRHAWEIVRQAGVPIPIGLTGDERKLMRQPPVLKPREIVQLSNDWQEISDEYVVPRDRPPVLLTALDRYTAPSGEPCSWRGLDWDIARTFDLGTPAVEVGRAVLASDDAPSLFQVERPSYEHPQHPSWWGVTIEDIEEARERLKDAKSFRPIGDAFTTLEGDDSPSLLLCTRLGHPTHNHTKDGSKWRTDVHFRDLEFRYRGHWERVILAVAEPDAPEAGEAVWIRPDAVRVDTRGRGVKVLDVEPRAASDGTALVVTCHLRVRYSAKKDSQEDHHSGRWNPKATLLIESAVREWQDGAWSIKRTEELSVPFIVPSGFSPTVFIGPKADVSVPGNSDWYLSSTGEPGKWEPETTPDISLDGEDEFELWAYDGELEVASPRFLATRKVTVGETVLDAYADVEGLSRGRAYVRDGDLIVARGEEGESEVASVRVGDKGSRFSSSLAAQVKGNTSSQAEPERRASESFLGRAQQGLLEGLTRYLGADRDEQSLFQYIVSTADTETDWEAHAGTPKAHFLCSKPNPDGLPGIGDGPSEQLQKSDEWNDFQESIHGMAADFKLEARSGETAWMSSINFGACDVESVRDYLGAHTRLIQLASGLSLADRFWASFPFSVVIVAGGSGPRTGQLLSVLLSPLHPARLAWTYSVSRLALESNREELGDAIFGLAEGWNIPLNAPGVSAAGNPIQLVASPLDPGRADDFAGWSGLVVLEQSGLRELPSKAAGMPIHWAGQSGINDQVVRKSLRDFVRVHPHLTSLEIDLRSLDPSPRSSEVDEAILDVVAGRKRIGGGTRVWDSDQRLGQMPSRDEYLSRREGQTRMATFEWRRYSVDEKPPDTDIAFIENPSVHLSIEGNEAQLGVLGLLPIRRFAPDVIEDGSQKQFYGCEEVEDLLGLSRLLRALEHGPGGPAGVLKASPSQIGLGLHGSARWEILGTFNAAPSLVSSVLKKSRSERIIWEWRPSWLNERDGDLAKRPYYVVAKVPRSLLKELEARHGLSSERCLEMLSHLGERGIGLASLNASGGTQASAALGFYYAIRLLGGFGGSETPEWPEPPDPSTESFTGIIPLDPIYTILRAIGGQPSEKRADLIAVRVSQQSGSEPEICLLAVEAKHRAGSAGSPRFPNSGQDRLDRAISQLSNTSDLLRQVVADLTKQENGDKPGLSTEYMKRVGLATLVELAFSLSPDPPAPGRWSEWLKGVLAGQCSLGIGDPLLLWFASGAAEQEGIAWDSQVHQEGEDQIHQLFFDPEAIPGLLWTDTGPGENEDAARLGMEESLRSALSSCRARQAHTSSLVEEFASAFQISVDGSWPTRGQASDSTEAIDEAGSGTPDTAGISKESDSEDEDDEPVRQGDEDEEGQGQEAGAEATDIERDEDGTDDSEDSAETEADERAGHDLRLVVGAKSPNHRWMTLGTIASSGEKVGLDLDNPKTIGVLGYMGSGKSYFLGTLIESAVKEISGVSVLPNPLSVVVFNYRRNPSDRFELASLAYPNAEAEQVERLRSDFGAEPTALDDVHVVCLPGELTPEREREYGPLNASELRFDPESLTVEDWELLMGEPGSSRVYAKTIRDSLSRLRDSGEVNLELLREDVGNRLSGQSQAAADLRFDFVERYVSPDDNVDFESLLRPGRVVIIDLRRPLFNKEDALRFFLICARQVSQVQGEFNKLVVFDEAHEYMSTEFSDRMEARIRQVRHEGTSYVFATQDVGSLPKGVRKFITTKFVFELGTKSNVSELVKDDFGPEFKGQNLIGRDPGSCLVQANVSTNDEFASPLEVEIRPRVTAHGGASRIYVGNGD